MSLQWVRLDTAFPRNHKVLTLLDERGGKEALFAYVCGLAFSGEQGYDGFIPRAALPFVHAKAADVKKLTEVGLWHEQAGGWQINDWAEFQPTTEETTKRSQRAREAAAHRWSKKQAKGGGE